MYDKLCKNDWLNEKTTAAAHNTILVAFGYYRARSRTFSTIFLLFLFDIT